jgi:hypothetical protein
MPNIVHGLGAVVGGHLMLFSSSQKSTGSGHSAENIGFKSIASDSTNMGTPRFKSFSAFNEEIVTLINSCNARDRTSLMIENFVGDVWSYAEPCHSGDAGSS